MNHHDKHCMGVGCDPAWANRCAHHSTEFADHVLWFSPTRTGESCDAYRRKTEEKEPCDVRT